MKRDEMIEIIRKGIIDYITSHDYILGKELRKNEIFKYLPYKILNDVEDAGMKPPSYKQKQASDEFGGEYYMSVSEWETEEKSR